jgi:hypothetical protein
MRKSKQKERKEIYGKSVWDGREGASVQKDL